MSQNINEYIYLIGQREVTVAQWWKEQTSHCSTDVELTKDLFRANLDSTQEMVGNV
jgi:hypothetical protein